ncbi:MULTISPECIES: ATP-grasp domain-containing protein [Serratia]|uniref:ATP-grasp domain-containing protein n=1 Tax=Serratia TaxID=613 RepID=UPI0011B983D8|nr:MULTISPECIES: ATP-grasp domain-containing protein [Serratia]MDP8602897.1 ATP-grasp domain-containing protein [Serratia marcescens]MDP8726918.1 ATP-grasp domain-containing protein [Serratia marcescens]MDP8871457.1 ATP-grasp domain-containing protein [Serratia marcescens]TWY33585.1 ATP-grasp domain-containing protein [Serratia marcescens]
MKQAIIFVHPWMWAEDAFEACQQRNYLIFSVVTSFETLRINQEWLAQHSDDILLSEGDARADANELFRRLNACGSKAAFVVNGLDAAFGYANALSRLLHTPALAERAELFLNKTVLNEYIQARGVPVIPGLELKSVDEFRQEVKRFAEIGYPLIAKPSEDTAAMADVEVITSEEALRVYLCKTLGRKNRYYTDRAIEKITVQQYVSASSEEFFIDFFSYGGQHQLVGAGKYLYDENRTLKGIEIYNAENVSRLNKVVEYIIKVLNVAGMQNGFSHNEVFLTQEGKPLLVESNPRHCGQPSSTLYKIVYGTHRMHTLLDALENKSLLGNEAIYRTGAHACALHLYNFSCDKPAFINTYGVDSEITVLSFRGRERKRLSAEFYLKPDRVNQISAILMLVNTSVKKLSNDCETIWMRETDGTLFSCANSGESER